MCCRSLGARPARIGLQRFDQRAVAHAVRQDVHVGGTRLGDDDLEELGQLPAADADRRLIDGIGRGAALRGPAVEDRCSVEVEVICQLGRAPRRVLEGVVESVHEDEQILGRGGFDLRLQVSDEIILRQRREAVEQHVAAAQLAGIEDVVGPAGLRLEFGRPVRGRDGHVEIAELEVPARLAVVSGGPKIARGRPVRAVVHPDVGEAVRLGVVPIAPRVGQVSAGRGVQQLRLDLGRGRRVAGGAINVPQTAERGDDVWMPFPIGTPLDGKNAKLQCLRVLKATGLQREVGEARQRGDEVRMIGAELALLQSPGHARNTGGPRPLAAFPPRNRRGSAAVRPVPAYPGRPRSASRPRRRT